MAGAKRFLSTVVTTDLPAGDGVWQNTCGKPLSVTIGAQAITTSVNSCMTLAVGIGTTVFGSTLGSRIDTINGIKYINYIIPGLTMMTILNQAYQNSASSIMQGKYLKFIEDILILPLSGFQIALGYIIGGAVRGLISGFGILIICYFMTDFNFF